jgi:hypothetical protein
VTDDPCVQYHCPECGEHVALLGARKLIALHRDPSGKRCDATGAWSTTGGWICSRRSPGRSRCYD